VANISYRLAQEARAPAAAEDVRNAIDSIRRRADQWEADAGRMLLVGFSAGAQLALLAALAPSSAIAGPQCRAWALASFWGITDVADLLNGDHPQDFARSWIADRPGQLDLARRLSPINYDVSEAPPLCAVHSVHDDTVPFAHSERLVAKFQQAHRRAKLIKLDHAGHSAPPRKRPAILAEALRFLEGVDGA
jgi:acetyl esterase/lipase